MDVYECVRWKMLWDGGMEIGGVESRMKGPHEQVVGLGYHQYSYLDSVDGVCAFINSVY
jgi:hypothetical protein